MNLGRSASRWAIPNALQITSCYAVVCVFGGGKKRSVIASNYLFPISKVNFKKSDVAIGCHLFITCCDRAQAMVLGNFQCQRVLLIWMIVVQGPTVLAVSADGVVCIIFLLPIISFLPLSWLRLDID